jgi:transcriptional regulator with XRE-family HTH domain
MDESKDTLPGAEKLKIGQKIKELRQKKHLTLQDLATKTQLDKATLARIEGDETVPPLGTLLKISRALDVSMAFFFEDEVQIERLSVTRSGERVRVKRRPHHQEGEVDYVYESLEPKNPRKHMEPFLVEGKMEFRTDDRVEVLYPGDSLYFESEMNHSFRGLDDKPARSIVIVWNKPE